MGDSLLLMVRRHRYMRPLFGPQEVRDANIVRSDRPRTYREAEKVFVTLTVQLPRFQAPVYLLSGGQRQAVAIGRVWSAEQTS